MYSTAVERTISADFLPPILSFKVSVLVKEGMFFKWKNSALFVNKGAFLPKVNALGVNLKFDNERTHPP